MAQSYGKILLVEDDLSLARWIGEYLIEQGYAVVHVDHGDAVVDIVHNDPPDLILLDVMLPGVDGIQVCKELRKFSHVPIIMLTARGDELDEVIGLEVGANDYVVKPIRPRALLARTKMLIQKSPAKSVVDTPSNKLVFDRLCLDHAAKRVTYGGKEVELSSSEFELLWYLATQAGKVVGRDAVFHKLKGREYDGQDRRFDLMVSALRKKLGDNSQNPKKIKTIWGRGYLFVSDAWG